MSKTENPQKSPTDTPPPPPTPKMAENLGLVKCPPSCLLYTASFERRLRARGIGEFFFSKFDSIGFDWIFNAALVAERVAGGRRPS